MSTQEFRYVQQVNNTPVTGPAYAGYLGGSTRNNGGVIRNAGTVGTTGRARFVGKLLGDTFITGNVVYLSDASNIPLIAAQWTERNIAVKAVSTGQFAQMRQVSGVGGTGSGASAYVMRRVTTFLGNVSNTCLRSGGSDYGNRRSILAIGTNGMRTSYLAQLSWAAAQYTGPSSPDGITGAVKDLPTYTAVVSNKGGAAVSYGGVNVGNAETAFGQNSATATVPASQGNSDVAAIPSLANPGQLVYKGQPFTIKLDTYKTKTLGG
jgi:hypothetical protein